ncbi:MAG: TonB-dependent receptor [Myxococcales bacterium]|jgi:outer membrane receptor protein involved in Fe transport
MRRPLLATLAVLTPLLAGPARATDAAPAGGEPARTEAKASEPAVGEPRAAEPEPTFHSLVRSTRPVLSDATADSTQVDGERLRASTRASMLEALAQEAGDVYVPGRGGPHGVANGASGAIHVRGLGGSPNSQVLVVEDGVPDYQGIFGHPLPDAFNAALVDQVAILKGGDSVLYGTNAMGGVLVVRSRWLEDDGLELTQDAGAGSFGTLTETLSLLGRHGSLDYAGAVHLLRTDGHRDGAGGANTVVYLAARQRLPGRLRLTVRNKLLRLSGADPGPAPHPHPDHWYAVWRDGLSAQLELRRGLFSLRLTPYLNAGDHRLYDGFHSRDYTGGAIVEAATTLHPMASLIVGAAFERVGGAVEQRLDGEQTDLDALSTGGLYQQLTLRPLRGVTATLGARELATSFDRFVFLYKAGLRWDLPSGVHLQTRIARNYRQPTLRELYLPFPTANPDLRPELAVNWDLGIGWETDRIDAGASLYRTSAQNLIKYFGAWPTAEVVNIDRMVVWGVEGHARVRAIGPIALRAAGNWQRVGRYTKQNPAAKLDFGLESRHSIGAHALDVSLSGEWTHDLYMNNYGRDRLSDPFFLDAGLRLRLRGVAPGLVVEPYLTLRNLLNGRYAYIEGYPMPPFGAFAGLTLRATGGRPHGD